MKKIISLITCAAMLFCVAGCNSQKNADSSSQAASSQATAAKMNVYVLAGPTGIGAVNLWDKSDSGETQNKYKFTCVSANDEIVAAVSNGEADIAAVATNLAATLYNKTNGGVNVIAVNTLGVLSMLTKGSDIKNISELKGKTIYTSGQGANPEYILRYVLNGNGLDPDKDVIIKFVAEGSELASVWASEPDAVIMAPQPVATSLTVANSDAKTVFDMTEEWKKVSSDSTLMMGCVIVRKAYLDEHKKEVDTFLKEYEASVTAATTDAAATGTLCEKYGIIPKAAIATKAIPSCGLTFVTGSEMKTNLSGYLNVMFTANPKSVGGKLPVDDFYYGIG